MGTVFSSPFRESDGDRWEQDFAATRECLVGRNECAVPRSHRVLLV